MTPQSPNSPAAAAGHPQGRLTNERHGEFFNASMEFGQITPCDGPKDVNARSGDVHRDGGHAALYEVECEVSAGPQDPQDPQAKNARVVE